MNDCYEPVESQHPHELRTLAEAKFRRQLAYVASHSPFYQRKWEESGVQLSQVRSLDDLPLLPLTEKDELRRSQEEAPPLGAHMTCEWDRVVRLYSTSGTTGRPCYVGLTAHDLQVWLEVASRARYATGIRQGSRVVTMAGQGPFVAGSTLPAYERIGATTIPLGPKHTDRLVQAFQLAGADTLACTPSFAGYLEDWLQTHSLDARALGIRLLVLAGEPGGGIPAIRERLAQTFGCRVREVMGLADIAASLWGECSRGEGMHFCGHEAVWVELIDPRTGVPIPAEDGAQGELVYTALDRECVPLIRYRSRDHVTVWTERCACGRTSWRIRCLGRTDDMLLIKGVNLYPSAVQEVVARFAPATSGPIRLLAPVDSRGSFQLVVESPLTVTEGLKADLERAVREHLLVQLTVDVVPVGTLPRSEYKGQLVVRSTTDG